MMSEERFRIGSCICDLGAQICEMQEQFADIFRTPTERCDKLFKEFDSCRAQIWAIINLVNEDGKE